VVDAALPGDRPRPPGARQDHRHRARHAATRAGGPT
jgi:hypothetical protein